MRHHLAIDPELQLSAEELAAETEASAEASSFPMRFIIISRRSACTTKHCL
jgi:hypothetical protein